MEFDFSLITGSLPLLLQGALVTLEITALSVGLGLVFGLIAALAQISKFAPLRLLGKIYVDFIRGTPLLVQIFIIYFALPVIIGQRIDPFVAAAASVWVPQVKLCRIRASSAPITHAITFSSISLPLSS